MGNDDEEAENYRMVITVVKAPAALLAVVALLLLALAACGGRGDGDGGPVAGPLSCESLSALDRYRFEGHYIIMQGEREGEATPDDRYPAAGVTFPQFTEAAVEDGKIDALLSYDDEALSDQRIIVVGETYWLSSGGPWAEHSVAPGRPLPILLTAESLCRALGLSDLPGEGLEPAQDTAGGMSALRYDVAQSDSDLLAHLFGAESDMARFAREQSGSIWVDPTRKYLIRADLVWSGHYSSGRPMTVEIFLQLRDINDSDISVDPPPAGS